MSRLVSVCAVALFVARPAQAFVVYDTGSQAKIGCGIPQPQVLHWERSVIPYHLAVNNSGGLDLDDVEDTVKLSFDAWAEPVCFTDARTLRYDGRVPSATVGFDAASGAKNVNAVLFVESGWSHGPGVLGLTTLTYDRCGGVIVDADIELNDQEFDFSVSAVPPTGRTDLRNTVTHEAGHFLGLDHSKLSKATMYAKAPSGETIKRDLEQDDINGLCHIYEGLATCDVDCDGPSGSTSGGGGGGCAGAGGGAGPAALLLLAFIRAFRASRRRPGGAAPAPPR